ncbi:tol-pal system YbgF family protein [Meridianimaribacter flavus]
MKKYYFYILTFLILTSCSSLKNKASNKNEKLDIVTFNKGVTIFEMVDELSIDWELQRLDTLKQNEKVKYEILKNEKEEILELALDQFGKIIQDYPNSELYHKSLYNLAHISSLLDYEEDEIKYLEMILNSNANDKENSGRSGIMSNPYANFKNDASKRLTEIHINKGEYKTALKYKKLNEKYPLQHFCGNAFAADEIYNAKQYAKIYIGLGDNEKVLSYLLPHIFNNGLASNSSLVELTTNFLKENYSQEKLRTDFENSTKNIYSKVEKNGDNEWTNYYIKYFDSEIEIPSWSLSFETDNEKTKSELEKTIKESEFYKKLNE